MVTFPNAKINIGLNVLGKRPDGYHDIHSCFYPIPWYDALEIIETDQFDFQLTGLEIPGKSENNLCIKALEMLRQEHDIPTVSIYLHKAIPMGAGLGGGSADASFLLKMLNEYFGLDLSTEQLEKLASGLGSDCPFFVRNQAALVKGTGARLIPFNLDLGGLFIVLINPGIHISTQEAYQNVSFSSPLPDDVLNRDRIAEWNGVINNDFESYLFNGYPQLLSIKLQLYNQGAIYASMTGSGSTIYGLFEEEPDISLFQSSEATVFHAQL